MSLTDDIYGELLDGLEQGLDWPNFLAKHSASKGPLYNAIVGSDVNSGHQSIHAWHPQNQRLPELTRTNPHTMSCPPALVVRPSH